MSDLIDKMLEAWYADGADCHCPDCDYKRMQDVLDVVESNG